MIPHIRSNAPGAYRSGEWAIIIGVEVAAPPKAEPFPCYLVMFPDSVIDLWVVHDLAAQYEFKSVNVQAQSHGRWGE